MQKIHWPECGKQFVWTDDSPPQGICPNDHCEWQYDIRKEIGKSIAKRANIVRQTTFVCPECGSPLISGSIRCSSCGTLILASRSVKKRYVAFFAFCSLRCCLFYIVILVDLIALSYTIVKGRIFLLRIFTPL